MTAAPYVASTDPIAGFIEAMEKAGISIGDNILADGTLHRFHVDGDGPGTKNGWYALHLDGIPAGSFGCWKRGIDRTWCARSSATMTEAERAQHRERMEAARRQREEEQARIRHEAAKSAASIWDSAGQAEGNPYLAKKKIQPYGVKWAKNTLVVPMRDTNGELHSLQFIDSSGQKLFLTGGRKVGCCHLIGTIHHSVVVAEGYATAATIHEATGLPVVVAFDSGNLRAVAEAWRAKLPAVRIIIAADNDQWSIGNPGFEKAKAAAEAVRGSFVVPTFRDLATKPTDFNDLASLEGIDAVRTQFSAATSADSATSAEPPRPLARDLQAAKPYPVDDLGSLLGSAVKAIHNRIQAPLAICAQSVLAVASLAAQGHANVVLPTGKSRPLSCYFITVAESGERKSASDDEALWPIRRREEVLRTYYEVAKTTYENDRAVWERSRQQALSAKKEGETARRADLEALGPAPTAPLYPMLTSPEPTFEGVCRMLDEAQPSAGLFSTEGGQFVGGYSMSPENRLRTGAAMSSLWDGDPIKRVRGGDGLKFMVGRRLALHLMVQPRIAPELLADESLLDQGILSRMLVAAPTSAIGFRPWREPSPESEMALKRYGASILSILEKPLPRVEDRQNEIAPRDLPLSNAARAAWIAYANHIEEAVAPGGSLEAIRGLANKLPEHAARLAGVIEIVEDLSATDIGAERMAAGIRLADHYCGEALRLFEAGHISPELRLAIRTLEWLRTGWAENAVSLPDLYKYGPNSIRDAATARRVAKVLEDHGYLIRIESGAKVGGVYRREAWGIIR